MTKNDHIGTRRGMSRPNAGPRCRLELFRARNSLLWRSGTVESRRTTRARSPADRLMTAATRLDLVEIDVVELVRDVVVLALLADGRLVDFG